MSKVHHIPCPACSTGAIRFRKSGALVRDDRTGLLCRECLVTCTGCGRNGKALLTLDIAMYLDGDGLCIDPAPFPTDTAA